MAVLAPRKRVIETFVNKDLAQASRTMINNTRAYRALKGEYIPEIEKVELDKNLKNKFDRYMELMS